MSKRRRGPHRHTPRHQARTCDDDVEYRFDPHSTLYAIARPKESGLHRDSHRLLAALWLEGARQQAADAGEPDPFPDWTVDDLIQHAEELVDLGWRP